MPSTPILLLRFPDGDVRYHSTRGELPIGAVIRARGSLWRVRSFHGSAALLEAVEEPPESGGPGGPIELPSPFGDNPLTHEILVEA